MPPDVDVRNNFKLSRWLSVHSKLGAETAEAG